MDAVTLQGIRKVGVERVPLPVLQGPGEALVRVRLAGLCGSDMHPYCGREAGLDMGTIMGHEFVGIVEQGAQAEVVGVPLADSTLVQVPDTLKDDEALLCGDVLATATYCVDRGRLGTLLEQQENVTVAVVGCGPVGLLAAMVARLKGASQVFAVDMIPERLALAEKFGAVPLGPREGAGEGDMESRVREMTEGRGADVVLEAVGSQGAVKLAYRLVRPGGVISSVGFHTGTDWGFSPIEGYGKNITYSSGRCPARAYMDTLLQNYQGRGSFQGINATSVITHRVSLHDSDAVSRAYTNFDTKADGCIKVVFEVGSTS